MEEDRGCYNQGKEDIYMFKVRQNREWGRIYYFYVKPPLFMALNIISD